MTAAISRADGALRRLLNINPFRHQSAAVAVGMARLEEHGSFALLHDMGAGKTKSVLGMFAQMVDDHEASTMLVVCPASVIQSWAKEASGLPVEVLSLTGPVAKREAQMQRKLLERAHGSHLPLIVVTNYEAVWRMEGALRLFRFDLAVCDESQRIKAPGAKQTRAMQRIGATCKYRIIMSGTPASEGQLSYFAQMKFLDVSIFGPSFANHKARYAVERDFGTFRKVVALRNTEELEMKVMARAHRVSKEDALDLPSELDVIRTFSMSPKATKIYDQLAKESIALIEDEFGDVGVVSAQNVLTRLLRLQQLTSGFAALEEGELERVDKGKLDALRDLVSDLNEAGEPVIIYHRFRADGEAIRKLLESMKVGFVHIDGSVPTSARGEAVRAFQEDEDVMAFVGQIESTSTGITLHRSCSGIFYSMSFSGATYDQARSRYHRIGQARPVTHYHLAAEGTVDEMLIDALRAKRKVSDDCTSGAWERWFRRGK